jgi:hypothetical protein
MKYGCVIKLANGKRKMSTASINESDVEKSALAWLEALSYNLLNGKLRVANAKSLVQEIV